MKEVGITTKKQVKLQVHNEKGNLKNEPPVKFKDRNLKVEGGFNGKILRKKEKDKPLFMFANPTIRRVSKDKRVINGLGAKKKTTQPLCILSYQVDPETFINSNASQISSNPQISKLQFDGEKYIKELAKEVIPKRLDTEIYQRKNGTLATQNKFRKAKMLHTMEQPSVDSQFPNIKNLEIK